jgi:hypothetical protein
MSVQRSVKIYLWGEQIRRPNLQYAVPYTTSTGAARYGSGALCRDNDLPDADKSSSR